MKRMKHPLHGFHNAYDGNEEARLRTGGWTEAEPSASAPAEDEAAAEAAEAEPAASAPVKRRGPNKPKAA